MRQSTDKERVVCPNSGEKLRPERCWDSAMPDGRRVTYGIIPRSHTHRKSESFFKGVLEECEWSGLPAPQPVELME